MTATLPALGPRERELLLRCARVELDPTDESAIGELAREPLDWDAIAQYARLHSVAPLVHRHLGRLEGERVPAKARRELLAAAHRFAFQNRVLAKENAVLLAGFEAVGIPVIIPRGISTAELVYGDLHMRPLIDLTFLLHADRLAEAGEVVLSCGYRPVRVRPAHAAYQWTCPQSRFVKQDASRALALLKTELIDTPSRRNRFRMEAVWPHARPATVTGQAVLTLGPIDQVLALCLPANANGHFNQAALGRCEPAELLFAAWSNNRLVRFVDIRETVRHHGQELAWERLVDRARSCGIEDAVHACLALTERLLGSTAPADALEALSGVPPSRMRRAMLAAVSQPRPGPRRAFASAWERIGQRRQKEFFRLVALVRFAFPERQALRAERPQRSASKVVGISALHAVATAARAISNFLVATFRDRDAQAWPTVVRGRRISG